MSDQQTKAAHEEGRAEGDLYIPLNSSTNSPSSSKQFIYVNLSIIHDIIYIYLFLFLISFIHNSTLNFLKYQFKRLILLKHVIFKKTKGEKDLSQMVIQD